MSWGAVAGAVVGGLIMSDAAGDAADAQAGATADATGEQRRQYDLTRTDQAPYREQGQWALGELRNNLGQMPTSAEVMSQPGYQFGLQQGQQALDRKASAAGGRMSGATLKRAAEYATNYAATGYNAEYQRRQDRLARLQTLAGLGQSATSGTAQAGQNSANAISDALRRQGDASGAYNIARGNIWGGAVNQIGAQLNRPAGGVQATPAPSWGYGDGYINTLGEW